MVTELMLSGTKQNPGLCRIRHNRHTNRSWLDQVGTQLAVQQKAMPDSDIRTTIIYGDAVDGRIGQALEKVSGLIFGKQHADRKRGSLTY